MGLSTLALSIAGSPTLQLNEKARVLREQGEAVIHLGIGEPKNRTPDPAITSSVQRLNEGDVKYAPTDGTPSLKAAIVRYTEQNYGRLVGAENVIVSSGAKQSIYNILYGLLNPKDEVVLLAPYWVSYPEMVRMCRGIPVMVRPENGTFHPNMSAIERAVTPATKAIICNSPNNPSGVMFNEAFIADLVGFCESKGLYLVMDDIYHKLVFNGRSAASPYRFASKDLETSTLIVVNGVSKLYGMTGFRIGWAIAPKPLVEVMTNVQAQITSCASPVMQAGAEGALKGPQGEAETLRQSIQSNRDVMMRELASLPGVSCQVPDGTFYCLPNFEAYRKDSVGLAEFLLEKARVVTVPGRDFGMDGYLRLSFSGSAEDVTEGVARIKWALDPDAPKEIRIGERTCVRDWD